MKNVVEFLYLPGDRVNLVELNRPGVVTGALRDSDGHQYRVVWWEAGNRQSQWLFPFEISTVNGGASR